MYSVLSAKFKGSVPMSILSSMANHIYNEFNNERKDYFLGERSIKNYKKDIPRSFQARDIKNFRISENNREFEFTLFSIPFRAYLGRDLGDKRNCMLNFMSYKQLMMTSGFQLKKGKIYLLAAFAHRPEKLSPDSKIIAEAFLSVEVPVVVTIQGKRYEIGRRRIFL